MSKPGRVIGPEEESLTVNGSTANGILTYGGANQIDVETVTITSNTINNVSSMVNVVSDLGIASAGALDLFGTPKVNISNGRLDIGGTSSSAAQLYFYEDTDNGTDSIRIVAPSSITGSTLTLPDSTGTFALTNTARSLVKLKGDDFYLALVSSVNRWYHVAMYGQSISTSSLDGLSIADSTAIRTCSFIATQNCTVHKVSVAWYQTVTADLEWEIVKVPIVNNSTSNVTLATMTATDCDDSYTANTNYMKVFTVSGGNTLTEGQGLAVCVRRTSGSSSILYGWANAEIEITD